MIKNDRQFGIIRGRVERLQRLQDDLLDRLSGAGTEDRTLLELELRTVGAEIRRMQADLDEYQALKAGRAPVGTAGTLEDLPRLLIRARIASGLTQAELAKRLRLKEQQIQRYEASDYETASLARLVEIARVLDLRLAPSLPEVGAVPPSMKSVLRRLADAGVPTDLVERRFAAEEGEGDEERRAIGTVTRLSEVFGWAPDDVFYGEVPLKPEAAAAAAYKKPTRVSEPRSEWLAAYAQYLAERVLLATPALELVVPTDPIDLHGQILKHAHTVSLTAALATVWDCGVPVLPLDEPGGFHAGYWEHDGRPIIVLNPAQRQESRWLFDLLHEVGHIATESGWEGGLLEDDPGAESSIEEGREHIANRYATETIFGGRSQELFDDVIQTSGDRIGLLQRSVRMVARRENVEAGVLAFNVAYRLAEQGQDWWGAAMNLQGDGVDPWEVARSVLLSRVDWDAFEPLEADVLARALDLYPPTGGVDPPIEDV